ncbi:acyltransferase [Subsaxibacter sp. CAU 1640]|uniref:acyltransferase family protein n=1 Tax=Subsaxibacter sp. CAU 1640 TaxID=2933271 RepID=UPI0020033D7A|nr:acyltransferase [Subsaxibacter sp. CAU 1640]MCK7590970.1 acyltransferase [Subsaxibacter sp. CAU 1640]
MGRKHFHTFDALRFFSFLLVFLLHLPKSGNVFIDFFLKSGGIGVTFFFVLSGFLITYILLYEKQQTQKISLKNFFARRILRIWPLFYLMIAFAYLSPYIFRALNIPYVTEGYEPHLLTSMVFGENYMMMLTNSFPDGAPLRVMWTLCIEEHFYIVWGLLFYFLPIKRIPLLIVMSIIISNSARAIYSYFGFGLFDLFSNLDYFAFGAIPAYMLICKGSYIVYAEKIPLFIKYLFLALTIAIVFTLPNINVQWLPYVYPSLLAFSFATVILFTLGSHSIHIKDDLWFSKLGTYTYGLYLYHTIVILSVIQIFKYLNVSNWIAIVLVSLVLTILVSILSYHLFEKQFLKLKRCFY